MGPIIQHRQDAKHTVLIVLEEISLKLMETPETEALRSKAVGVKRHIWKGAQIKNDVRRIGYRYGIHKYY